MNDWSAQVHRALADASDFAVQLRHDIHQYPDLSGEEGPTSSRIERALTPMAAENVASGSLLIRVGPDSGPAIAVRAELDALPVIERTGLAWSARGGRMHACGHDVHMAALAALCRAVDSSGVRIPLAMLAVFQPREESIPSGALDLVRSPAWAAHGVAAVVGAHVHPLLSAGVVAATAGVVNAAVSNIEIVMSGPGGHAAYPHTTSDPVLALSEAVLSLQQAVSRRIDPTHAAVAAIGVLRAGIAPGVIPDQATAAGTLRVLDPHDLDVLEAVVVEIAEGIAHAHRCTSQVSFDRGEPVLENNEELTRMARIVLRSAGKKLAPDLRSCGADDFAHFAARYPSLMMYVGVGEDRRPSPATLHQPTFCPGDDAINDVAQTYLAGFIAACDFVGAGQTLVSRE